MTALTELRRASLGGVAFSVEYASDSTGRNLARHEYPGLGVTGREDVGKREGVLQVDALVIGDDYVERSTELLRVCDRRGTVRLVHPWLGDLLVRVESAERRFEVRTLRMARVSLALIEEADLRLPTPVSQPGILAAFAAAELALASAAGWIQSVQNFISNPVPAFVRRAIGRGAQVVLSALSTVSRARKIDLAQVLAGQILGLQGAVDAFNSGGGDATKLPTQIQGAAAAVYDAAGGGLAGLLALEDLAQTQAPTPGQAVSAMGVYANQLEAGAVGLLRAAALAELVRRAAEYPWESFEQAQEWLTRILARLDAAITRADDETFEAILRARTRLLEALPPPLETLPRVVAYETVGALPVVIHAYELTGSADGADALTARNRIAHPLFAPGGATLEALLPAEVS